MREKLIKQTGIFLILVLALFLSKNSNITVLERGADTILTYAAVNYTTDDIREAAKKGATAVSAIPGKVGGAVSVMAGKPAYGDPIDENFRGQQASVYAVGGGQVAAVGENEEIGKYIRITHGDQGESLYGNLKDIYVEAPSRVKKGQIIGLYEISDDKEFYYSFREFN